MKIKTNELTGPALDWAVAKCAGMPPSLVWGRGTVKGQGYCVEDKSGRRNFFVLLSVWREWQERCEGEAWGHGVNIWRPSTDWSQGGPIIERELHNLFKWNQLDPAAPEIWCAVHNRKTKHGAVHLCVDGPTPLIAAMRCYVASKLGEEVDIPEELL